MPAGAEHLEQLLGALFWRIQFAPTSSYRVHHVGEYNSPLRTATKYIMLANAIRPYGNTAPAPFLALVYFPAESPAMDSVE